MTTTRTVTIQAQQKWEYNCLTRKTEATLINELNQMGQEGWEVITVLYYKDIKSIMAWTAFVKRPSSGDAPKPAQAAMGGGLSAPAKKDVPSPEGFDLGEDDFKMEE